MVDKIKLQHIAIIMDGNGRWAKKQDLSNIEGHKKGAKTAQEIVKTAAKINLEYLTLYTFSTENWQRPKKEVEALMTLLNYYLKNESKKLHKNNIKVRIIGDLSALNANTVKSIKNLEQLTEKNTGLNLNLAINYGGRQEILQAVNNLLNSDQQLPNIITAEIFSNNLYTKNIPDPDIIIRTSGEMRLSNFLLWQSAYTELFFIKDLWPDFTPEKFISIIEEYNDRERRYGSLSK